MLTWENKNPYHVVSEAKIALFCSEYLSVNETIEFKENLKNILELHKIKLENGLKNEYIELSELQKTEVKITHSEVEELIKLL